METFDRKTVFVTGASSGIGRALAMELAGRGARLGLFARRKEELEAVAQEVRHRGAGDALALPGDVRNPEDLREAVTRLVDQWGSVDAALLSAGVGRPAHFKRFELDRIRETIETNLLGVVNGAWALLPVFRRQGRGLLVGISSVADRRGSPLNLAYCASKAGVSVFLEGLRAGCRKENIRVVTVKPGFVRTAMTEKNRIPMPFILDADEAARRIVRGIEKGKRVIRFPWPLVWLVSIYNLLPAGLYDRLFGRAG